MSDRDTVGIFFHPDLTPRNRPNSMMNSISKIHLNSTTGVSLNDRFTVISRISPGEKGAGGGHERNGGGGILRKRSNSVDSYASRSSYANRQLVNQLDRRHIGQSQAALRLRNVSLRRSMTSSSLFCVDYCFAL